MGAGGVGATGTEVCPFPLAFVSRLSMETRRSLLATLPAEIIEHTFELGIIVCPLTPYPSVELRAEPVLE